jgi:hypothetical protein
MSFWQIVFAAWGGAFGAIRRNPVLFGGVFLALYVAQLYFDYLTPIVHHAQAVNPHLPRVPRSTPARAALGLLDDVITSLIAAPLMLTVHRFILLGENQGALSKKRRLVFFALYLLCVRLMGDVPTHIEGVVRPDSAVQVVLLLLTTAAWIVTIRLLLAYPAAALERPVPLLDSLDLTRGHWWYIVSIMICGWLPLMIVDAALLYAFYRIQAEPIFGVKLALEVFLSTAMTPLYIASGAALVSELYRKFDGLKERQPFSYMKSKSARGRSSVWLGGMTALGFYLARLALPKAEVSNLELILGIMSGVLLLLIGLLLAYGLLKQKARRN